MGGMSKSRHRKKGYPCAKYICAVAFAHSVGGGLYASLKQTFNPKDAENLYGLALLRAAFGDIKDYQMQDRYE